MLRNIAKLLAKSESTRYLLTAAVCLRRGSRLRRDNGTLLICNGERRVRIARKHLVYAADIAAHFDTYFTQAESDGREVDYSRPRLHTLANGLQFELSSLPEEMPATDGYFRFFRPAPGDTVFDIGAYCGVFTYMLSQAVDPAGRVIAFEPDPVNREVLQRNIARHGLGNVTVVPAAVSDKDGDASFSAEGALGSALVGCIDRDVSVSSGSVPTMSLETAAQRFGVPSFIKIDAEGAEIEILSGASGFLCQHNIAFALDTNHMRGGELTAGRIESIFAACGYHAESLANPFMTTWAHIEPHGQLATVPKLQPFR